MFRWARRPWAWIAALVALGLALSAAYVMIPPLQTKEVARPPADATPEQVVEAYTDALDGHDCETAQALTAHAFRARAEVWCDDIANLSDVQIGNHSFERPGYSGSSSHDEVADVGVSFNLDFRPFHGDGSMSEGFTSWGYLLKRRSPENPWRIFGEGVG